MPYLWQGASLDLSQTLLVMGATAMSPSLMNILLTPGAASRGRSITIFHDVVVEIERYSVLSPSLSLSAEIIKEAEVRRRAFLKRLKMH